MKNIVKFAFIAVFTAVAGYGVYVSQKPDTMSELMLANVEALASDSESGSNTYCCAPYNIVCYKVLGGGNVMGLKLYKPCNKQ